MNLGLLDIPQHPMGAFECNGGRRLTRLYKSSGGGGSYYESLERLYDEQAQSARILRQQAEKYLPGMTDSYAREVNAVLDSGYAERQAEQAGADIAGANAMERSATERQLAGMGVNPADRRYATSMAAQESSNAARLAAGQNIARNEAKNLQRAVAQDAVGTFTGQSNQASSQMASAASGLAGLAQQQSTQAQQQSQNIANMVGGTMAMGSMIRNFKDGGRIRGAGAERMPGKDTHADVQKKHPMLNLKRGAKRIERHMLGGSAGSQQGFFQMQALTPPPPSSAQNEPGPLDMVLQASQSYSGMQKGIEGWKAAYSKLAGKAAGNAAGNAAATGVGSAVTESAVASLAADTAATAGAGEVGAAIGSSAVEGALATTAVEGGAAAGMGALGAAGAAVATALPWVGAAYAVGSLLELWKDGGEIRVNQAVTEMTPAQTKAAANAYAAAARKVRDPALAREYHALSTHLGRGKNPDRTRDYRAGRAVEGPGEHTDDLVPALLSDGEHVINAEAAALIGHRVLEKLNQKGLALRARGLSPAQIERRLIRLKPRGAKHVTGSKR